MSKGCLNKKSCVSKGCLNKKVSCVQRVSEQKVSRVRRVSEQKVSRVRRVSEQKVSRVQRVTEQKVSRVQRVSERGQSLRRVPLAGGSQLTASSPALRTPPGTHTEHSATPRPALSLPSCLRKEQEIMWVITKYFNIKLTARVKFRPNKTHHRLKSHFLINTHPNICLKSHSMLNTHLNICLQCHFTFNTQLGVCLVSFHV